MEDRGSYTKPHKAASSSHNKKKPSKFYSHFLFKAAIVAISLVIIPLFPSEAPDVISPSIFSRWWELLHLIFVGIAVSYGLFSRKNDDSHGDVHSKFDSAQSYVSKLLQVPSVFDDDVDSPTGSDDHNITKVQTWSSQYYRNEPVVVVAKDSFNVDNKSGVSQNPLLLPVRSLRSRVSEENDGELVNRVDSRVYARSNSSQSAKEFPIDSRRVGRNSAKLVREENYGVSRGYARSNSSPSAKGFVNDSRRMSRNDSVKSQSGVPNEFGLINGGGEVSRSLSNSNSNSNSNSRAFSRKHSNGDYGGLDDDDVEGHEENNVEGSVVLPSPIPWRSRSGKMEIKRDSYFDSALHSLPASLKESGAAQLVRSQSSLSSQSSSSSSSPKELSPSPSLSSESLAKSVEDCGKKKIVYGSHLPPPPPPPPPPPVFNKSSIVKSNSRKGSEDISSQHKDVKQSGWSMPKDVESMNRTKLGLEAKARNSIDSSSMGKSVRTFRGGEIMSPRKTREFQEEQKRSEDIGSDMTVKPERKTAGYNPMSKTSFSEFPKETRDFLEQVLVGTDDESESEDENYAEERVETPKVEEAASDSVVDEGPDVDKKADEFIAKFREQIRLQRIESIKRSAGQLKRSTVR